MPEEGKEIPLAGEVHNADGEAEEDTSVTLDNATPLASSSEDPRRSSLKAPKPTPQNKFLLTPLTPSQLPALPIKEYTLKLKRARINKLKWAKEEEKLEAQLKEAEQKNWKARYSKAVIALEKERRKNQDLQDEVEGSLTDLEELEQKLQEAETSLQASHANLRENAVKLEQTIAEKEKLTEQLKDRDERLQGFLKGLELLRGIEK